MIGFVGTHGDAFKIPDLAKEFFDEVKSFVEVAIEWQRLGAPWVLRDDDFSTSRIEGGDDDIAVENLVGDQAAGLPPLGGPVEL